MNHQFTIIKQEAEESGQHLLQSQSGRKACWLEGWIAVPEEFMDTVWDCGGYCDITVENGVITGVTQDMDTYNAVVAEREAAEAAQAAQPTLAETVAELQTQLDSADETAVELYEAQLAQEEINEAQDEALAELYESLASAE